MMHNKVPCYIYKKIYEFYSVISASSIAYTGMLTKKADGSKHHLKGIIPDIILKPTMDGINYGQDGPLNLSIKTAKLQSLLIGNINLTPDIDFRKFMLRRLLPIILSGYPGMPHGTVEYIVIIFVFFRKNVCLRIFCLYGYVLIPTPNLAALTYLSII